MAEQETDLITQLDADLTEAMKARDAVRLQVLRLLKAALKNHAIEVRADLSPQEMLKVLQKEAKKRQDAIDQFAAAGRTDLVEKEQIELEVLKSYLPEQVSEADIAEAVHDAIKRLNAEGTAAMGQVVSAVREHFNGAADGAIIARLTREALQSAPNSLV